MRADRYAALWPSPRPPILTSSYMRLAARFRCKPTTIYHLHRCHCAPAGRQRVWSGPDPPRREGEESPGIPRANRTTGQSPKNLAWARTRRWLTKSNLVGTQDGRHHQAVTSKLTLEVSMRTANEHDRSGGFACISERRLL